MPFAPVALALALLLPAAPPASAASGATMAMVQPGEVAELRHRLERAERLIEALLWGLGLAGATGLVVGRLSARRQASRARPVAGTTLPSMSTLAGAHESTAASTASPATLSTAHGAVPVPAASPEPPPVASPAAGAGATASVATLEPGEETGGEVPPVDIDQQAQFLMVLGQDEAAIDLLLGHLRGTGGTSPLPYLRLMQIYRARYDEPAYERTRERFNQRFNAVAPAWDADSSAQRGLETYRPVLSELQRLWRQPLDARALLETLLYRRGSADDRFDLAAYEELLFLHGLTDDLIRRGERPASPVDVLLPIDEAASSEPVIQAVHAQPRPGIGPAPAVSGPMRPEQVRVDVDLSTRPARPDL